MRTTIATMVLAAVLMACGTQAGPAESPRSASPSPSTNGAGDDVGDYFSPPAPFPGPTWTKNGRSVEGTELNSIAGPEHCGWQSAVLLHLGWPPGTVSKTIEGVRQYVRDPKDVLDGGYDKGLRRHITLPDDAADTGYRTGKLQLWLTPSDPDGAYLRVQNDVERWPRADPPVACA
ncbi:hypothetical protein ABN034_06985 [Actinopolymorpha sp. B11F2]|uniref:hypothetical protein n=1 Tax=Actinopolymorpha sp. B11F2 TaxID=3160862 RepID=UPI0032E48E6B